MQKGGLCSRLTSRRMKLVFDRNSAPEYLHGRTTTGSFRSEERLPRIKRHKKRLPQKAHGNVQSRHETSAVYPPFIPGNESTEKGPYVNMGNVFLESLYLREEATQTVKIARNTLADASSCASWSPQVRMRSVVAWSGGKGVETLGD